MSATSERRATGSEVGDTAPDFDVLGAGPGSGRVYVNARSAGQDRGAIYLYNSATGELGSPLYQHESAEWVSIWIDPRSRALWAACAHAQRAECTTFDAEIGRHLTAIRALFERNGRGCLLRPRLHLGDGGARHLVGRS